MNSLAAASGTSAGSEVIQYKHAASSGVQGEWMQAPIDIRWLKQPSEPAPVRSAEPA